MSVLKTYGGSAGFKPSKTYQLINGRIEGKIDGLKAATQAVELALNTERFAFPVYSWDYGMEWSTLIGKDREYVEADIRRRIQEALLEDDRVLAVTDFSTDFERERLNINFTVKTTFGDLDFERSVAIG